MKNWMPTVSAVVSAVASYIPFAESGGFAHFPPWVNGIAMFVQMGGLISLGITAKQYNVTGGSIGQPSTHAALVDANQAPSQINPPAVKE